MFLDYFCCLFIVVYLLICSRYFKKILKSGHNYKEKNICVCVELILFFKVWLLCANVCVASEAIGQPWMLVLSTFLLFENVINAS